MEIQYARCKACPVKFVLSLKGSFSSTHQSVYTGLWEYYCTCGKKYNKPFAALEEAAFNPTDYL